MTAIKNLEKRVAALEPEPPGEDFSWLSILSPAEVIILDQLFDRWEKLPENERVPTPEELDLFESIDERRELYDKKTTRSDEKRRE